MWRLLARTGALLVGVAGLAAFGAAPAAAAPGFEVAVTGLPGTFRPGAAAAQVSAVVSTTNDGCRRVRWSLLLRVEGVRPDQVRVDRIEQDGSFPVRVETDGNTARITDNQLDPGTLCPDRTVTAQYRVAVAAGATGGRITLTPEAYDANQRLLAQASAVREIVGDRARPAPTTTPPGRTPTRTPEATGSATATDESVDSIVAADEVGLAGSAVPGGQPPGAGAGRTDATAGARDGDVKVATVGFVAGGLLLFVGVGLLLRLRQRIADTDEYPPGPGRGRPGARTVPRGGAWAAGPRGGRAVPGGRPVPGGRVPGGGRVVPPGGRGVPGGGGRTAAPGGRVMPPGGRPAPDRRPRPSDRY